eukprot:1018919-Rhodomonas_salina.1
MRKVEADPATYRDKTQSGKADKKKDIRRGPGPDPRRKTTPKSNIKYEQRVQPEAKQSPNQRRATNLTSPEIK